MKLTKQDLMDLNEPFDLFPNKEQVTRRKIEIRQHIPSYVSGVESKISLVENFNDIFDLDWVKLFSESPNFYGYFISTHNLSDRNSPLSLIALTTWNEEFHGCEQWYVIGYVSNITMFETGLRNWKHYIVRHKPDCWIRKYNSCKDIFDSDDITYSLSVAKDLGWNRNDFLGIAITCSCGLEKLKK